MYIYIYVQNIVGDFYFRINSFMIKLKYEYNY